jgi:hypothetical protein
MTNDSFKDIEKLKADLWEAPDNLRANSNLPPATTLCLSWASSSYGMPPTASRLRQAD